jgi:tetratricopeptide (TPR) repeat protein
MTDWQRFARAVTLREDGDIAGALQEFRVVEAAATSDADRALVMLNEVECLTEQKNYDAASSLLNKAKHLDNGPFVIMSTGLTEGDLLLKAGKPGDALRVIEQTLQYVETRPDRHEFAFISDRLRIGRAFARAELRQFDEAICELRELLPKAPDADLQSRTRLYLGQCLFHVGRPEEALRELSGALTNAPPDVSAKAYHSMGVIEFNNRNYGVALQHLQAAERRQTALDYPPLELYRLISECFSALGDNARSGEYARLQVKQ